MGSETGVVFARRKRWEQLQEVFLSFGPVALVKEHWNRNCVFVVFQERQRKYHLFFSFRAIQLMVA